MLAGVRTRAPDGEAGNLVFALVMNLPDRLACDDGTSTLLTARPPRSSGLGRLTLNTGLFKNGIVRLS